MMTIAYCLILTYFYVMHAHISDSFNILLSFQINIEVKRTQWL